MRLPLVFVYLVSILVEASPLIFSDRLEGGGHGPIMVVVPAGSHPIGSAQDQPGHESREAPVHLVNFSRPFALARTETTVADFRLFVAATGYVSDAESAGLSWIYDVTTDRLSEKNAVNWRHDFRGDPAASVLPVTHVSWRDATAYAEWLASNTGQPYRLPSEAEFEYANRAGSQTAYWWGAGPPRLRLANLAGENDRATNGRRWPVPFPDYGDGYWGTAPVASFPPNPFGLYDTTGNVWEWTRDCYNDSYEGAPTDGSAWLTGDCSRRILRGGSWSFQPRFVRSAYRMRHLMMDRAYYLGFRVARSLVDTPLGQQCGPRTDLQQGRDSDSHPGWHFP